MTEDPRAIQEDLRRIRAWRRRMLLSTPMLPVLVGIVLVLHGLGWRLVAIACALVFLSIMAVAILRLRATRCPRCHHYLSTQANWTTFPDRCEHCGLRIGFPRGRKLRTRVPHGVRTPTLV